MFFLSDVSSIEFRRRKGSKDKVKRKKSIKNLINDRESIRNNREKVKTTLEPVKTGQKIWSTLNQTSREIRSWKKLLGM